MYTILQSKPPSVLVRKKYKPRRPLKLFSDASTAFTLFCKEMWNPWFALQRPHGVKTLVICVSSVHHEGLHQSPKCFFFYCNEKCEIHTLFFLMLFPSPALPVMYFWMLTTGFCHGYDIRTRHSPVTKCNLKRQWEIFAFYFVYLVFHILLEVNSFFMSTGEIFLIYACMINQ